MCSLYTICKCSIVMHSIVIENETTPVGKVGNKLIEKIN